MEPLTVPGTLDSLPLITDYVLATTKLAQLNPQETYRLRLAVDEIAINIVTHGYAEVGLSGELTIQAHIKINKIIIQLIDKGMQFNPLHFSCQEKVITSPNDLSKEGGFGVLLALSRK